MKNLKFALKAWPVVTLVTIGLCFLTGGIASLFGIELHEQESLDVVRQSAAQCFSSLKGFLNFAFLVSQIVILMPAIEEVVFRGVLYRLPSRIKFIPKWFWAGTSSVLFSAAHYWQMSFPDNAFLALFVFGLLQCRNYDRAGRIWVPMTIHALFNLTNLVLIPFVPA